MGSLPLGLAGRSKATAPPVESDSISDYDVRAAVTQYLSSLQCPI